MIFLMYVMIVIFTKASEQLVFHGRQ
jgi:hypothetical protein